MAVESLRATRRTRLRRLPIFPDGSGPRYLKSNWSSLYHPLTLAMNFLDLLDSPNVRDHCPCIRRGNGTQSQHCPIPILRAVLRRCHQDPRRRPLRWHDAWRQREQRLRRRHGQTHGWRPYDAHHHRRRQRAVPDPRGAGAGLKLSAAFQRPCRHSLCAGRTRPWLVLGPPWPNGRHRLHCHRSYHGRPHHHHGGTQLAHLVRLLAAPRQYARGRVRLLHRVHGAGLCLRGGLHAAPPSRSHFWLHPRVHVHWHGDRAFHRGLPRQGDWQPFIYHVCAGRRAHLLWRVECLCRSRFAVERQEGRSAETVRSCPPEGWCSTGR